MLDPQMPKKPPAARGLLLGGKKGAAAWHPPNGFLSWSEAGLPSDLHSPHQCAQKMSGVCAGAPRPGITLPELTRPSNGVQASTSLSLPSHAGRSAEADHPARRSLKGPLRGPAESDRL